MEVEDVNEQIEWEARRVALALGLDTSLISSEVIWSWGSREHVKQYTAVLSDVELWWNINLKSQTVSNVTVGGDEDLGCQVVWTSARWEVNQDRGYTPYYRQILARALYRLGIEDEHVLTALDHPLSAHEKLELRLSLPREFWPQKWRTEEVK